MYEGLLDLGATGTFIGRARTVRDGRPATQHSPLRSWRDCKLLTALIASVTGRDYWQLKMLSSGCRQAVAQAASESYDAVLVNMLYALPLAQAFAVRGVSLVVDTHNYDPAWFESLSAASGNLVLRQLCRRAAENANRALARLPEGTLLVHVSETDASRYRLHRPDLEHRVVENGTNAQPRHSHPDYLMNDKCTLIFVGSLSAQANQDALENFATHFWPRLRPICKLLVVGSFPSAAVCSRCRQQGWLLFPNVNQEQLDALYAQAHFAILPFAYGEGSKLKLLEACGQGVPVLTTQAGICGISATPHLVTVSDSAQVWVERVQVRFALDTVKVRDLIAFAQEFSWQKLSSKLAEAIERRTTTGRHLAPSAPR